MQVSYNWLQELIPFEWTPQELAEHLTMAGLEVERVHRLGEEIPGLVTGLITFLEKHPEADDLLVAQMTVAKDAPPSVQVVTGAKNIKVGDRVPLALPGAELPGGNTIKEVKFRGVSSQGMMCSAEELGLEPSPADEGGIMILPPDTPLGKNIEEVLGWDDYVLEIELTPDRGDCLSMLGVAREVAALTGSRVRLPAVLEDDLKPRLGGEGIKVTITDFDLCPRYTLRLLTDIKIGPSPLWMQQRLRAMGMRPINNMVDVTNYVMLELGQPLHAFDRELVQDGEVIVRRARTGEKIVTLDDQERVLDEDMLLITDPQRGIGIAGVMGGADSEITAHTNSALLESACFNSTSIRKTVQTLGLRSEASNRFEKGVDPNGTLRAANRVAYLMEEMGAARAVPLVIDVYPQKIEPLSIILRPQRVNKILGTEIPAAEIKRILTSLEFTVTGDNPFTVSIPTFRPDITMEQDLIEEVARIYGYDRIRGTMVQGTFAPVKRFPEQQMEEKIKELLTGWGCTEIITYSFYSPRYFDYLRLPPDHPARRCIPLSNPLSEIQSVMRTTALPSMIEALAFNLKHKNSNLALFEVGRLYWGDFPLQGLPQEPRFLALGLAGKREEASWKQPARETDFFSLKGLVEELVRRLRIEGFSFVPSQHPSFHPGRQAALRVEEGEIGVLGELHPDVAEAWEVKERLYLAELNLEAWAQNFAGGILYRQLPRYPAVARDLAIIVDGGISAAEIEDTIKKAGGDLLVEVRLFDHYKGDQVPAGKKSLAYSLLYQAPDRTLTDEVVSDLHGEIIQALTKSVGAVLR